MKICPFVCLYKNVIVSCFDMCLGIELNSNNESFLNTRLGEPCKLSEGTPTYILLSVCEHTLSSQNMAKNMEIINFMGSKIAGNGSGFAKVGH